MAMVALNFFAVLFVNRALPRRATVSTNNSKQCNLRNLVECIYYNREFGKFIV